jgi:hypothetical protein
MNPFINKMMKPMTLFHSCIHILFITADALLEIGTDIISVVLLLDKNLSQTNAFHVQMLHEQQQIILIQSNV